MKCLLILGCAAGLLLLGGPARAQFVYTTSFNGNGTGGALLFPSGVAIDAGGNVYVGNLSGAREVSEFSANGTFIANIGSGQFVSPEFMAFDHSGNLFVVDNGPGKIYKFDSSGALVNSFGNLGAAIGVALDASGNIYATSVTLTHIQKFNSDGTGQSNFGPTLGSGAHAITVAGSGNIYVSQPTGTVIELNSTGTQTLQTFGAGQLSNPYGVAVDANGDVFVADTGNNRVVEFNSSGSIIATINSAPANSVGGFTTFSSPQGIALDANGDLFISDMNHNRILEYSPMHASPEPSSLALTLLGAVSWGVRSLARRRRLGRGGDSGPRPAPCVA